MKSPLYITGINPDGKALIGGIFAMKDQEGFPVDASLNECKLKGVEPDWAEYLADAGRQSQWKFDAAMDELRHLLGDDVSNSILCNFKVYGATLMLPSDDFPDVCQRMIALKKHAALKAIEPDAT